MNSTIANLVWLMQNIGAVIKVEQYVLYYRDEWHPNDNDWGYVIINTETGELIARDPCDIQWAIAKLSELVGGDQLDDIPF